MGKNSATTCDSDIYGNIYYCNQFNKIKILGARQCSKTTITNINGIM